MPRETKSTGLRKEPCVAVIGDMVRSRALTRAVRPRAQSEFTELVASLNRLFASHLVSRFVITLGDEFQGLLDTGEAIPDLVWMVESEYRRREIRLGFGFGRIDTPIPRVAINVDGPALHNARAAIDAAKSAERREMLGGVFQGFGPDHDEVLNGFARILRLMRERLTPRQFQVVSTLRLQQSQTAIASTLRITKQSVSQQVKAAGWNEYIAAERGWRAALRLALPVKR